MVSAIQAVPNVPTAKPTSLPDQLSQSIARENVLFAVESTSLTLNGESQAFLTYNSEGVLADAAQVAAGKSPTPLSSTNTAAITAPPSAISTVASTAPAQPNANIIVANAVAVPDTATALATTLAVDTANQVLANLTSDPAYAGMASSLYVRVSIYRAQQTSNPLPSTKDVPQPVTGTTSGTAIDAGQQDGSANLLAQDFRHQTRKYFAGEMTHELSEPKQIFG